MSIRDNSPEGQKNRQKIVNEAMENWKKSRKPEAMKTDDELIAEFMAFEFKRHYQSTGKPSGWYFNNSYVPELKYHKSWDWLMPVVDKIEALGFGTLYECYDGKKCNFRIYNQRVTEVFYNGDSETKIDVYYKTIVEFIKWYNTKG